MTHVTPVAEVPVVVIGAGPGGLAVAGALAMRGVRAVVLERADDVASAWRTHYDRLHLHTDRALSGLPGLRIPRHHGRWVSRDAVVEYLESYARHHDLDIRTGTEVARVERMGEGWAVTTSDGTVWRAPHVVVATGYNHTPRLPAWPGSDTFHRPLLHASRYRNAEPYRGRDVLVVGTGNTGCEIATDLHEGGAARVRLAVRTPPHILRRANALGVSANMQGIAIRHLPVPVVDAAARVLGRLETPDLSHKGLPRPEGGLYSRVKAGSIPVQDVGIVAAVENDHVEVVPTVERLDGAEVVLVDGSRVRPDAIIAATGYTQGLEPLVGHLGVLGDRGLPVATGAPVPGAPGLWFTGYTNPISGMFRELRLDAERIAERIAPARPRRAGLPVSTTVAAGTAAAGIGAAVALGRRLTRR